MQGLRPYVQDENALAGLHRPAALKAAPLGGSGLGGTELGGQGGPRKGVAGFPQGPRKALGNITNRVAGGFDAENTAPGKTPAACPAPAPARRALGDITNSNASVPTSARQAAVQKTAPAALQPAPQQLAAAAAPPPSRADLLAEGGVERLAGHGWEALERERLVREDAEIQRRLAALANFPTRRALPNFFPLWGSGGMEQALRKDVLPTPPASPPAKQRDHSAGLGSAGRFSLCVPDLGEIALPDIAFPDIDDAMEAAGGLDGC